ncbi:hypothetical protein EDC05_006567, partial [Coemansia umbellata]
GNDMSNTAASEQRTWDGIQENDSVAWTAVTNYKHASMPIHITAPTTIDDSILAMVQQLTLKEKVGQMTQIQVGQLVDCNGYINKTAV